MVTADGQVRIVNACTNADLFWGLKGGGGGSLGVVTRLTLRTRELPAVFGAVGGTVKAASDVAFRRLIARFVGFYGDSLLNPHWGESVTFAADNSLIITMVFQGLESRQAQAAWQPFIDWLAASRDYTVASPIEVSVMPAQHWWDAAYVEQNRHGRAFTDERPGAPEDNIWFAEQNTELGMFIHGFESVWLPEALLRKDRQGRLADALFAATRSWAVALHFNKGLAGANPADVARAKDAAKNPAMLTAFALAIIAGGDPAAYANPSYSALRRG